MLTRLAQFVTGLHPHQRLGLHAKGMLEADRHISRQSGPSVKDCADRLPTDAERISQIVNRNTMRFDNFGFQPLPRMEGKGRVHFKSHGSSPIHPGQRPPSRGNYGRPKRTVPPIFGKAHCREIARGIFSDQGSDVLWPFRIGSNDRHRMQEHRQRVVKLPVGFRREGMSQRYRVLGYRECDGKRTVPESAMMRTDISNRCQVVHQALKNPVIKPNISGNRLSVGSPSESGEKLGKEAKRDELSRHPNGRQWRVIICPLVVAHKYVVRPVIFRL